MTHARPTWALPTTLLVWLSLAVPAAAAMPRVPEGFEIRLVAAVPAVEYPCQVATAPDGSLFVAEDPMDQIGPADKPIDRILIFRGENEPVVFAEKLNAVFGMAWHDGALYVMNMPNLTAVRNTDGDGKADERKEIFTDLGVPAGQPNNFNDHIVSGLQFGIDGYLYISVGDKGVPRATGPDGRTAKVFGGGVLRCRPDGTGLEVFTSGTRNHLEPNLDERDNLFTYDNTDDGLGWWTRVTHHIDGGYYGYPWDYHNRTDRMLNRMAEYGGGSPCGGLVYKEDAWPEKYRGMALWAEWAKRTVRGITFEAKGSSFAVASAEDFIAPAQVSDFRPLDLALSYDGRTLYVADWGYGGWANKKEKLGRVYAVTYTGEVTVRPRGSDSDPIEDQIKALDHPSYNERMRAQTALIRAGKPALGVVTAALGDTKTGSVAKRHLVWVVDGIAGGTPAATGPLVDALMSPLADVRAQAARALGERAIELAVYPIVALLSDPEPTVRLQAVIALGRIGRAEAVPSLVPLVAAADDAIAYSARKALRRINDWETAAHGLESPDPKVRQGILLTLEMVYETEAARAMARFAADPAKEPAERSRALELLAQGHHKPIPWDGKWWGTQPAKRQPPAKSVEWTGTQLVFEAIRARLNDGSAAVRLAAVSAVKETNDEASLPALRAVFGSEADIPVRRAVARVLGAMKDKEALPLLVAALRDKTTPEEVRDESLAGVEAIGTDEALTALLSLFDEDSLGAEKQPRLIAALGRFKSPKAAQSLVKSLKSPSAGIRAAAAEALGKNASAEVAGAALRELLADPALDVRKAAISALGALKDHAAVPQLIEAAGALDTRFEATAALAEMPEPKALSVYLRGLTDRSPDLRKSSSDALAAIRDEAVPVLEKLAGRKELPSTVLPELRKIYTRMRPIQSWRVLGTVPIDAKMPFSLTDFIDLSARFDGFGDQEIRWKRVRAIDGKGQVDLGKTYNHDDDREAYGYATLEAPLERKATFAVGSDDTLTVWINGEKAYDFQDRRGYKAEGVEFDAPLAAGTNQIVIKCGNRGGPWLFSVAVAYPSDYAFLQGPAPGAFDAEAFRKFSLSTPGKAEHGRELFTDLKGLACIKCHSVSAQGGSVGPELTSVGVKYPKDELITAVLYPSAKISSGYEPVVIATSDGKIITGIIKGETPDEIELEDGEAKRLKIAKSDIDERKASEVSLMPNGLAEGLSREDFADLIAYLETLKDKDVNPPRPAGASPR